jgi:ABC-type antimicrobial peptide transport system permease subunit
VIGEIGIRMALGAQQQSVRQMFVPQGLLLTQLAWPADLLSPRD